MVEYADNLHHVSKNGEISQNFNSSFHAHHDEAFVRETL